MEEQLQIGTVYTLTTNGSQLVEFVGSIKGRSTVEQATSTPALLVEL
jgi:hypothetical protein